MEITNGLKGRFCKLYGIPINLYEEPYFQSRLELLDKQYGAVEKYKEFLDSIAEFKTEQDYYEHYNKVKDSAISAIKNNATFQQFNEIDMSGFNSVIKKYQLPSKPIYKPSFDGKHFISIDMKQANFSTLYNFDNTMFDGAKTWEEYIGRFTERKELIESKYMRQRIFGECNPKRQVTYQKYLMCKLLAFLLVGIPEKDIVFFSHDEIVIDDTEKTYIYYPFVEECINKYNISTNVKMRIERFQLKHLGEDVGYAKVYDNESRFDLKCVDNDYIPMIFRFIQTGRILEEDLAFFYKGTTAKFAKIPDQIQRSKLCSGDIRLLKRCAKCGRLIQTGIDNDTCIRCFRDEMNAKMHKRKMEYINKLLG